MARCEVCFRHCEINEGGIGFCGARSCREGKVCASNYGRVTSLALDPIEKKPLNRFHPGSKIVSVGSYGCNLRCPFCQNDEISWSDHALGLSKPENANGTEELTPDELVEIADRYRSNGNNEPLVGYEYVRDAAKLSHEKGMLNVLVTNGCAELSVLDEISPYIDAMNIDLKGFTDKYYNDTLGGNRDMVMRFIEKAVTTCHVELTTLIIPGENDSEDEMREITSWISDLKSVCDNKTGADVPLHISRFFPRFKMTDRPATDVAHIYHLADIAREKLKYVYTGNC